MCCTSTLSSTTQEHASFDKFRSRRQDDAWDRKRRRTLETDPRPVSALRMHLLVRWSNEHDRVAKHLTKGLWMFSASLYKGYFTAQAFVL